MDFLDRVIMAGLARTEIFLFDVKLLWLAIKRVRINRYFTRRKKEKEILDMLEKLCTEGQAIGQSFDCKRRARELGFYDRKYAFDKEVKALKKYLKKFR